MPPPKMGVDALAELLFVFGSDVALVTCALFERVTPGAARTLTTSSIVAEPPLEIEAIEHVIGPLRPMGGVWLCPGL